MMTTSLPLLNGVTALTAYPNPFSKNGVIQYELTDLATTTRLIITDLLGRKVQQQVITEKKGRLEIGNDLAKGVYFIQLEADGLYSLPLKVVKSDN